MSQYSHLTADLSNENSPITKIARLVGRDRLVLDVGCAHGYLAAALRAQGCRVIGIERDPGDAERAGAHCEQVVQRDVEEPGWEEELGGRRFDAIIFSDVLEHLREPHRVLERALPLLVPETGFIVASIPNVAHVSVRLELLLGSFRAEPLGILDRTHLHFFTRDAVAELFASAGLAVDAWDCTTNEVADPVIADYLGRAGLPYGPATRELFSGFEAAAYQFIVTARPSAAATVAAPALEKPLEATQQAARALAHLSAAAGPRDGGLRVLQAVHQFLPRHAAGTEIYCSDLSFALARRGHLVRVLSGAPYREDVGARAQLEDDQAILVDRVPATRAYRWLGAVGGFFDRFDNPEARPVIRTLLDRMRPDVVHIQHLLYLSAELMTECQARGIPMVVMLNDYWFLCHKIKLRRRDGTLCAGPARGWNCCQCLKTPALVRSHLNPLAVGANLYRYAYLTRQLLKAERILAPSRYLRDVFVRNGVPAGRITVCDYGTASPPPELVPRLRDRPRRERLRFGFLGSFIFDKGVHVLVEAFNRLPAGAAELHLFGVPVEPAYVEDLERRARHPDIHWRGPVPHADRWRALAEIDVLVVPSIWYENSPLSIHEAQVAGVPVIGSAIGGIPELVHDGVDGRTVPADDVAGLAACLEAVVADPACVARWRAAIVPPKTMDAHVDEIEAIYRELCGRELCGPRA